MDTEVVLEQQTVITEGDQIIAVGPVDAVQIPANATRIDGRGKYLMPGMIDMHVHIGGEKSLLTWLANGVTTIRNMYGGLDILALRQRVEDGEVLGPRIFTSGPILHTLPMETGESVRAAATRVAREHKAAGYDYIKVYNEMSISAYQALLQAAHAEGIPVVGHVPLEAGWELPLRGGQTSIEHLRGYISGLLAEDASERIGPAAWAYHVDEAKFERLAEETVRYGTWNVPTFAYALFMNPTAARLAEIIRRPEMEYYTAALEGYLNRMRSDGTLGQGTEAWFPYFEDMKKVQRRFLRVLHQKGARLLVGTDGLFLHGFLFRDELKAFVDAGMTPYETLKASTVLAAEFFGEEETSGSVRPGMRADLLLVNANPLEEVDHAFDRTGVMVRGVWLSEEELQTNAGPATSCSHGG